MNPHHPKSSHAIRLAAALASVLVTGVLLSAVVVGVTSVDEHGTTWASTPAKSPTAARTA